MYGVVPIGTFVVRLTFFGVWFPVYHTVTCLYLKELLFLRISVFHVPSDDPRPVPCHPSTTNYPCLTNPSTFRDLSPSLRTMCCDTHVVYGDLTCDRDHWYHLTYTYKMVLNIFCKCVLAGGLREVLTQERVASSKERYSHSFR